MRIGIIGSGGAGIAAAWLLDERHEVTLFERNSCLGGHAHTVRVERDGQIHYADDGFSWFSDVLYPRFTRLLEVHGVATRLVRMAITFTDRRTDHTYVLPPTTLMPILRTIANVPKLIDLLSFNRAVKLATPLVHKQERMVSWGDFITRHHFPERAVRELFTPLLAGSWGGPYERTNDFSAYTLMKYFVYHRPTGLTEYPWYTIRDGAASYVERIAASLRGKILRNTEVKSVERQEGQWLVRDADGLTHSLDQLIVATGARDAQKLLRETAGIEDRRRTLDRFEYYSVRLATHGDPSFMPSRRENWRVGNIVWDGGTQSKLNVWVGRQYGTDVFTSYLGDREPRNCEHVSTFHLPLITVEHYRAQDSLWSEQGRDGLWFAGDWTTDIGCHEDAVVSAIKICTALDAKNPRIESLNTPRIHPNVQALHGVAPA